MVPPLAPKPPGPELRRSVRFQLQGDVEVPIPEKASKRDMS